MRWCGGGGGRDVVQWLLESWCGGRPATTCSPPWGGLRTRTAHQGPVLLYVTSDVPDASPVADCGL